MRRQCLSDSKMTDAQCSTGKHCNLELSTTCSLFLVLDRAIRECFPKLLHLDGQELPSPVTVDVDTPYIVKPCKRSFLGSDELKSLVLQFLQQYYLIHDYGDRQVLAGAYHEEACYSLTIPFHPEDPAPSSLCEYFKDSRNMKKLKNPYLQVQLLKHTKRVIVHTLCVLPKTLHDFSSFVVDMWYQTETMLCFSVFGVFEAVEGSSQGCVRAFTQTFTSTPASYSSLFIMNDELFVWDVSPKKTKSTFSIPVPTPSTSSMPSFYWEQQQMVQAFSTQSRMNLQWSQKYLQDNKWNYTRAGQVFSMLKTKCKIPEEAFKEIP
ncbi:nuclear RNA export factor 2-like [Phocoena sinus]|uniref:nuclear RNA export factor 2-like n=1 Tax=Phocoena sinus TaxID=42100 RepID=UPI0013C4F36B|nr:nuclear RNA export factor 2-like [Phocoena sinus]